jgi:hypothetical protein
MIQLRIEPGSASPHIGAMWAEGDDSVGMPFYVMDEKEEKLLAHIHVSASIIEPPPPITKEEALEWIIHNIVYSDDPYKAASPILMAINKAVSETTPREEDES